MLDSSRLDDDIIEKAYKEVDLWGMTSTEKSLFYSHFNYYCDENPVSRRRQGETVSEAASRRHKAAMVYAYEKVKGNCNRNYSPIYQCRNFLKWLVG